ncbi:MAG: IS701 family transposase [Deltaproteobacteria bacterium]|nr:MAG: IS701 family transposase [Deltaproteobacteria bacterium]
MTGRGAEAGRFTEYLEALGRAVGHCDRREPLRAYLTGLLLPGERKSVEPMAAKIDPRHVRARHQSMHHLVAEAPWDDRAVLNTAREWVLPQLERHGPVGAWVVDDTGIPKKGTHSVGVARQYCGPLGKPENCQVAVTVSLVNATLSLPCAYRLYLPETWARDRRRRRVAHVPSGIRFEPKWVMALAEIDRLLAADVPRAPVVADAGYGNVAAFRDGVRAHGLSYAVGVQADTSVWPPGQGPLGPAPWCGWGPHPRRLRRSAYHRPLAVAAFAARLPPTAWQRVRWREGTRGPMESRFAAVRVRAAHRDVKRTVPREVEWLLVEWPRGETTPTKYWLSTVPATVALDALVRLVKIRWRIERDFQELKDELGLDHYEGRGWRGFHHHGVLCIAAYAFLAAERARLSPPAPLAFLRPARVPRGFRPRGAATAS